MKNTHSLLFYLSFVLFFVVLLFVFCLEEMRRSTRERQYSTRMQEFLEDVDLQSLLGRNDFATGARADRRAEVTAQHRIEVQSREAARQQREADQQALARERQVSREATRLQREADQQALARERQASREATRQQREANQQAIAHAREAARLQQQAIREERARSNFIANELHQMNRLNGFGLSVVRNINAILFSHSINGVRVMIDEEVELKRLFYARTFGVGGDVDEALFNQVCPVHYAGPFNHHICETCGATFFEAETYLKCCKTRANRGRPSGIVDRRRPEMPQEALIYEDTFLRFARHINSAFGLCASQSRLYNNLGGNNWNPTMFVQGERSPFIGGFQPPSGVDPRFAEIAFSSADVQDAVRFQVITNMVNRNNNNGGGDNGNQQSRFTPEQASDLMRFIQLIRRLQTDHNANVQQFHRIGEVLRQRPDYEFAQLSFRNGNYARVYQTVGNDPNLYHRGILNGFSGTGEVFAVIDENDGQNGFERHRPFIVFQRSGRTFRIYEYSKFYLELLYPLLYYGHGGWSSDCACTIKEYARFHLLYRNDVPQNRSLNYLFYLRQLFQQYAIDLFMIYQSNLLSYYESENFQVRRRMARQGVLRNHQQVPGGMQNIGRTILPAGFKGGPRDMQLEREKAEALIRKFGRPCMFITFTANPHWREIQENLVRNQSAQDRPDLIVRVFEMKIRHFLNKLTKENFLGVSPAHFHCVEFQKRGLPHAHIVIWLAREDIPQTGEEYDAFISAEIPDPITQPRLYRLVTENMLHTCEHNPNLPCRAVNNGVCRFGFPKQFHNGNSTIDDGKLVLRRRSPTHGGRTVQSHAHTYDNRHIAPYLIGAMLHYECHISAEVVRSHVACVKYLLGYLSKGSFGDRTIYQVMNDSSRNFDGQEVINEIRNFRSARVVSSMEAIMNLFGFKFRRCDPPVYMLSVHLENDRFVVYDEDEDDGEQVANQAALSPLEAFFLANQVDLINSFGVRVVDLLYEEMPEHFQFKNGVWIDRVRATTMIGNIRHVIPARGQQDERYYLYLLLLNVRGPTSFEDLQVNGSHRNKCVELGLLGQDDEAMFEVMRRFVISKMPSSLRFIFIQFVCGNSLTDVRRFYDEFRIFLIQDYVPRNQRQGGVLHQGSPAMYNRLLRDLNVLYEDVSSSALSLNSLGLPQFDPQMEDVVIESPISMGGGHFFLNHINQNFNRDEEARLFHELFERSNQEQRAILETMRNVYERLGRGEQVTNRERLINVQADAGTGKTHLANAICSMIRRNEQRNIIIIMCPTNLAASMIPGAGTLHKVLHLSVVQNRVELVSRLSRESPTYELLRNASVILIDESFMVDNIVYSELDRVLKEATGSNNNNLFGGKIVVLLGDSKQIAPFVKGGTRADLEGINIFSYAHFNQFSSMVLRTNMRVGAAENENDRLRQQAFVDFTRQIGHGCAPACADAISRGAEGIRLPADLVFKRYRRQPAQSGTYLRELQEFERLEFVREIFPGVEQIRNISNVEERLQAMEELFIGRRILAPKNHSVKRNNEIVAQMLNLQEYRFYAQDSLRQEGGIRNEEQQRLHDEELGSFFRARVDFDGYPPKVLKLMIGSICILTQTVSPSYGLIKNCPVQVVAIEQTPQGACIDVKILTRGRFYGNVLTLVKQNIEIPIGITGLSHVLIRNQFPLVLAYSYSLNKAQGQTIAFIGLDLSDGPCFSPGQLYSAFTRATRLENIKIFLDAGGYVTQGYSTPDHCFVTQNPVLRQNVMELNLPYPPVNTNQYRDDQPPSDLGRYEVVPERFEQQNQVVQQLIQRQPQPQQQQQQQQNNNNNENVMLPPGPPVLFPFFFPLNWYGHNLTTWPPTNIQGNTLSWILCGLMSEALNLQPFPYTLLPDFQNFTFVTIESGVELLLNEAWDRWVNHFREIITHIREELHDFLVGNIPPDLHWTTAEQEEITDRLPYHEFIEISSMLGTLGVNGGHRLRS